MKQPRLVADQAGDDGLNDGSQDPVEDEHNVLVGTSCVAEQ